MVRWLPDALVDKPDGEVVVVEVKCPYSAGDFSIDEATTRCKNFCLVRNASGKRILRKTCAYYAQVQFAMHVCKAEHAYYLVWTKKEISIIVLDIDHGFIDAALLKLKALYFTHSLPSLCAELGVPRS